jgi:hypothetical protein
MEPVVASAADAKVQVDFGGGEPAHSTPILARRTAC